MNPEQLVGYFGYAAGAAGALVYFRGSLAKTTIALQRDEIEALSMRLKTVEKQNTEQLVQIAAMQNEIQTLKDLVKERPAISDLTQMIAREFAAGREEHKKMTTALMTMADHLIAIRK